MGRILKNSFPIVEERWGELRTSISDDGLERKTIEEKEWKLSCGHWRAARAFLIFAPNKKPRLNKNGVPIYYCIECDQ